MAQSKPGFREALGSLASSDYRRFALSLLLTSLAAQLIQVAILWQVYVITGSAVALGLTGIARAVPHIVLSMVGGVIADRFNRVRLIQSGQIANGLMVLALAAITVSGRAEVWHLYAATFLNGAFTAVTQPARTALIPRLVATDRLANAIALNATIQQVSLILGPALGGVAISAFGLSTTYGLNAASYLVAMVAIVAIRTPSTPARSSDSPWQSFLEGMQFVGSRKVIVALLALDVSQTIFGGYRALLPIFAERLGQDALGYGLLSAAPGVGSILGAAFIMSLGNVRYKGLYTIGGVLGYSVSLLLLAASPWFALSLVACGLLGMGNSIQVIPRNTAILTLSPDALRGRVEAFRSMLAGGAPPLGFTLAGAGAAAFGAPLAVALGSVCCIASVLLIAATQRELRDRNLGDPRDGDQPETLPSSEAPLRA